MSDVARLLQRFVRSEPHRHFARHAAFPVALTPDLLYRLWFNFQRDINGKYLNIPWVAVPDLLLSQLVSEVGYELYEMLPEVRAILLDELGTLLQFGPTRILELAEFTYHYAERLLSQESGQSPGFFSVQVMNSLAYTNPQAALSELARAFQNIAASSAADLLRLASLLETLSSPIRANVKENEATALNTELDKLQGYAKGLTLLVHQDVNGAVERLREYFGDSAQVEIAGVPLRLPKELTRKSPIPSRPAKQKTHPRSRSIYNILCFDGAGVRASLTAGLLGRLEGIAPGLSQSVNLVCGASNGALLALALASGMTPSETIDLIIQFHGDIYKDTFWDGLKDLGQLTGAENDNRRFKPLLQEYFGGKVLGDLKQTVLIPAIHLDFDNSGTEQRRWRIKFFHNYPGKDSDSDERIVDIIMRACSTPTIFPTYQGFADASLAAANPAMCAVAQALAWKVRLSQICLLSVGGGVNPYYVSETNSDWGMVNWAPHLMKALLEADKAMVHFQCKQLLGKRYLRVDPYLTEPVGWSDVQHVPSLMQISSMVDLSQAQPWLRSYFTPQISA